MDYKSLVERAKEIDGRATPGPWIWVLPEYIHQCLDYPDAQYIAKLRELFHQKIIVITDQLVGAEKAESEFRNANRYLYALQMDNIEVVNRTEAAESQAKAGESWTALKKRLLRLEGPEAIAEKADWDCPSVPSPLAGEPLTQSDLDEMHFERVWIDYGPDESGERSAEDGVVLYGKLYSIDALDGAGLEELLLDAVSGETLDNPTGTYNVYRRPTNGKEIKGCHD